MTWRVYQVVLRLRSPLHIGCGKVGNLQRTRSYVTGRVLWGALTMRLTRSAANGGGPATDSRDYERFGQKVHERLAFTYFYPATKPKDKYKIAWPWKDGFQHRFLSSYASTALSYPQQSAAEGMLHEVEFIAPNTLDAGAPVFLMGYVFEKNDNDLEWKAAFEQLQMGGERGYGWGKVELVSIDEAADGRLFDGAAAFIEDGDRPVICLEDKTYLLAHTVSTTESLPIIGDVEPLVGREWKTHVGQYVAFCDVCFTPGSVLGQGSKFEVGKFGVWNPR